MRGPKPPVVELFPEVRQELEGLLRRHSLPQQLALRARIILAAADGANNSQIARLLDLDVDTVRLWRSRWLSFAPIPLSEFSLQSASAMCHAPDDLSKSVPSNAAKLLPSPVTLPRTLADPSRSGRAARLPMKSSSAALCPSFHRAMPRACSKRGSQAASEPLLVDTAEG